MQEFKIAIAGFGGVGRATAHLLLSRRARYLEKYGADVRLVAVCGARAGLLDPEGLEVGRLGTLEDGLTGPDFVDRSGAGILIEAGPTDFRTGGPGLAYIRSALSAGRDTIVISKGALVHSGPQLRALAQSSGAILKLSGAAAAALPTIDLVTTSLAGSEVSSVEGILNATTNYLLDSMTSRGLTFDAALKEAQSGGFAEADPRNDTEGWDTACKVLLIANFGLGASLVMDDLTVEGLQFITPDQIEAWRAEDTVPKLIGILTRAGDTYSARVGIKAYPRSDPFALVGGKAKAIRITSDAMGETIAIGHGEEPLATAAAALKDLEHVIMARTASARSQP